MLPAIAAFVLLIVQLIKRKKKHKWLEQHLNLTEGLDDKEYQLKNVEDSIAEKKEILHDKEKFVSNLRNEFNQSVKEEHEEILAKAKKEAREMKQKTESELNESVQKTNEYKNTVEELTNEIDKLEKTLKRNENQARKYKSEVTGLKNFHVRFPYSIKFDNLEESVKKLESELDEETLLGTVLQLHLHSDNSKELRKLSNATNKEIKKVLKKYAGRYTTKANKTIYNLMIIGLQAEIQILLSKLKYSNLDESKQAVKDIVTKYLAICGEGNQNILSTIAKFLTEIEPLYLELIHIEYKYYMYREKEKEEQRLIKEQMRQEAAERKALKEEQKKLQNEEKKFKTEMDKSKAMLETEEDEDKIKQLKARLNELEIQMLNVEEKKEEIATLTLGKAGYVYIISNLGSFGEDIFKIGMTRRMTPQDRVDELGSASVPFKFDVHAMIFSDDAVALETKLHQLLNTSRLNKVNFRKEFFKTDIETLKRMVEDIDPTAEFVTTMLAEEYKQTISLEQSAV